MKKMIILTMILFTLSLSAKVNKMTILDFDNNSGVRKYNSLGKGLADMLTTDLTYIKGLRIVEREKLRTIMKEMNLSKSKYISRRSMLKLGKGLAANWILKGSFVTMKGKMRIDVSIISVETGEIVESASVEGWVQKFFDLEKKLIRKIVKAIHTKENRLTYVPEKKKEVKDFNVVLQYSKGVKLYDEGKLIESEEAFNKVRKFDNKFDYSDKYLKALEERIKKYKKTEEYRKEQAKKKKYEKLMKNFEKMKTNMLFYSEIITISTTLTSDKKFLESLKFMNFVRNNISKKDGIPANIYTPLVDFLNYQEIYIHTRIKYHMTRNKRIAKSKIDDIDRKILKLSETFINKYPISSYKDNVTGFIEDILEEKKKYKKDKEKYEKDLIKKNEEYNKEIKKVKKDFKLKLKRSNLKSDAKYRRNDVENELKIRSEQIEREKRNNPNKKILILNKEIHQLKMAYYNRRSKEKEKQLKAFPLKLKKDSLMYLINKAEMNWKYEEVRKIYQSIIKMKNLQDSERLDCYEIMLDNYLNEAKYKPEQYKEAKKFYKTIEKNLNLSFYMNKYIGSKTYLKNSKALKKINYEKKIEELKKNEKNTEDEAKKKYKETKLTKREISENKRELRKLQRVKKPSVKEKNELSSLIKKEDKLNKQVKNLELERSILLLKKEKIKQTRYELDREWKRLKESTKDTLKEFNRIEMFIERLRKPF